MKRAFNIFALIGLGVMSVLVCSVLLVGCSASSHVASQGDSKNYSKIIVGRWLGPRKFRIFHSDGTWGVQRNEDAKEDVGGRRWCIEGNKLLLTYPTDDGIGTPVRMVTASYTIRFVSNRKFITESDGYEDVWERYP